MPDPVLSEAPPSKQATLTVLLCHKLSNTETITMEKENKRNSNKTINNLQAAWAQPRKDAQI